MTRFGNLLWMWRMPNRHSIFLQDKIPKQQGIWNLITISRDKYKLIVILNSKNPLIVSKHLLNVN